MASRSSIKSPNGTAAGKAPAEPVAKPKPVARPFYTVVEFEPTGKMFVVDPRRQAKDQFAAMEAVMAERPENMRNGRLAAFLANSFKGKTFEAEHQLVLNSKPFDPLAQPGVADTIADAFISDPK